MSNKLKKGKQINAVLVGLFCLLFLVGCSELNSILKSKPLDEQDAARFVSKIRPYQEDKDSIYRRACYFQERRKHKLAVLEFHRVTQIDPTHAKAFNGMGVSYDHLGQFDLAMECYYKALAINPDLDYVQNNLGYSFLLRGDVDNAITNFKKAITINGENKRYHNNLGLAYAEKGLHDLAFQEFKLAGGSNKSHYHTKQIHLEKNKMEFDRQELEIGLNRVDIRTSRVTPHDSNRNLEKNADSLHRDFGAKAGTDRESSGNADLIGAVEPQSSVEETPSMNDSRAQMSANTLTVDTQLPTLDKIKKDSRYEEAGPIIDQKSSHPSFHKIFIVNQRHDHNMEIEISNGNGVRHMARRVGGYLKEKGYEVTRLTNAQHFHFPDTRIYYCSDNLQDAYQVAKEIPGWNEMIKVANLGRPSIKVKVLIGKDLVPYDSLFRGKGSDSDFSRPLKIADLRGDDR